MVQLEIAPERATVLWCMGANARKKFKEAVAADDKNNIIYYGAWMDAISAFIAVLAPQEMAPDGSETDKP